MPEEQARALMTNIDTRLWQLRLIRDDGRDANQYRVSPIPFYSAARQELIALAKEIETLKKFVAENDVNREFWDPKVQAYELEVLGLDGVLPVPQLSMEEAATEQFAGKCIKVDDGDTIFVDDGTQVKEIRFVGVDAPEKHTSMGIRAKEYLANIVLDKNVVVYFDRNQAVEIYGRVLGVVYLGDTNLNLEMIKSCLCTPMEKFGRHDYLSAAELKEAAELCGKAGPDNGVVKVMTGKTHAHVWVDGEDTGLLTPASLTLPIGRHTIMATVIDHSPDQVAVEVKRGEMEVKLYPLKMPNNSGILEIMSDPIGAEFVLDDMPMGKTPTSLEATASAHTVMFYLDGYKPEVTSVVLPAGTRVRIEAVLEKE
jgi:endonuclease YncB( thermonuclease family)